MSIVIKSLKIVSGLAIVLAIAGAIYQNLATKADEKAYKPVGKMMNVGGYALHMIDSQVGQATVVLDSGVGGISLDWCLVQPAISQFARVITYDRAGYAWSDASPLARTSENIATELHTMLHNAHIPAPYILVGESFGGLNVRLFASKYPDEVAGIVLVDAVHEDLFEKMPQLRPSSLWLYLIDAANYCGFFRLLNLLAFQQQKMHDAIAKYPLYLQRMYIPLTLRTSYMHAMSQEALLLEKSCKQLKLADELLGDTPLTVISADKLMYDQVASRMTQEQVTAYNVAWSALQDDLVHKSSKGKLVIAGQSGRIVSKDQPQLIVQAVKDMVAMLKN